MSCKTTELELLPTTTYEIKDIQGKEYELESNDNIKYQIDLIKDKEYQFLYCVSYRDPSLPEWILARGWWNDQGIWTPDGIWNDQ